MQFQKRENGRFAPVYCESFRRKVIEEYLNSDASKMSLLRKYDIRIKSGIQRWMKLYGYKEKPYSCKEKQPAVLTFTSTSSYALVRKMNTGKASKKELEEKIRELERQLQDEKLRAEAYARMIDKAEKELKIPIRKKSNTR